MPSSWNCTCKAGCNCFHGKEENQLNEFMKLHLFLRILDRERCSDEMCGKVFHLFQGCMFETHMYKNVLII